MEYDEPPACGCRWDWRRARLPIPAVRVPWGYGRRAFATSGASVTT
jgi:hypothetical protein